MKLTYFLVVDYGYDGLDITRYGSEEEARVGAENLDATRSSDEQPWAIIKGEVVARRGSIMDDDGKDAMSGISL